jgi:signal transduction histidine kinase
MIAPAVFRPRLAGVALAASGAAACTLLIYVLRDFAPEASLSVLYLPVVLVVTANWGARLGVITAVGSALTFQYFHVHPAHSFSISGSKNWGTATVFLLATLAAVAAGEVFARMREQAALRRRDAEARARVLAASDEERRRVVRDLHDGAQQRLVHTVITLKLARRALAAGDAEAAVPLVVEALEHAERATADLRELAHGILPGVLSRGGLRAGVDALASRTSVRVTADVTSDRFEPGIEATAYFVIAEALTNVVKHSGADHAEVRAFREGDTLHVEVRDAGAGGADLRGGSGLQGLDDRVSSLRGELRVVSPPGVGTVVEAVLPLAARLAGQG